MPRSKVGKPTGKFSEAGKPLFQTKEGEIVSEKSITVPYGDKFANVPSIQKNVQYSEDEIMDMLAKGRIKPTSVHESIDEAVAAAEGRSAGLIKPKMARGGAVKAQTKKLLKQGGMLQEGGTVDPVSGNDVPVGSMKEEVRDDIPAKLSEGEFVFPADVVRYIGLERLMQMRQAAKEGLKKMEAMGQMSNADEATEDDEGEFESKLDEIMEEIEGEWEKEEETEMQVGGMAVPQQQPATPEGMTQEDAAPKATAPKVPELTPEQMEYINQTAEGIKAKESELASLPPSNPTEGLKPTDIIKSNFGPDKQQEADAFINKVERLTRANRVITTRHNDTVIVGFVKRPGVLDPFFFSSDSPEKIDEAITTGIEIAKKAGIKILESDSKGNIEPLVRLGYDVKETEKGWSLDIQ